MVAKVTAQGLVIPGTFLKGVEQVEIVKEKGRITVIPTVKTDPVFRLGKKPVNCGLSDASESHDKYLYGA